MFHQQFENDKILFDFFLIFFLSDKPEQSLSGSFNHSKIAVNAYNQYFIRTPLMPMSGLLSADGKIRAAQGYIFWSF